MKGATIATVTAALALGGCASVMSESKQNVRLSSDPDAARVTVTNQAGERVQVGVVWPMLLYFDGEEYEVRFAKDGFEESTVTVSASPNGWYIGGNILIGGLIGWLIVDPATGAMYNLSPDKVSAELDERVAYEDRDDGAAALHVTLLGELPRHARAHLERIGAARQ